MTKDVDKIFSIEAHHDDYKNAMDVRWLCQFCHQAWHKEHGRGLNAESYLVSKAHQSVATAVREERITRPERCEECNQTRSEHIATLISDGVMSCLWCGKNFKPRRSDTKYCSGTCRRLAFSERRCRGKVSSVRELKDGRISVVIYMNDTELRPGQTVRVGTEESV